MNNPIYPHGATLASSPHGVALAAIWDAIRQPTEGADCEFCVPGGPVCVGHIATSVQTNLRRTGSLRGLEFHVPLGAVSMLVEERARVLEEEGFDAAHDAEHIGGELALAGACYLIEAARQNIALLAQAPSASIEPPAEWPWHPSWWKPGDGTDPRSLVVKAGQLLLAELDRLLTFDAIQCPRCKSFTPALCPHPWHEQRRGKRPPEDR